LKPIEHLILDESVSEVMVNGPDHVFVEKAGYLQEVPAFRSASDFFWWP
jgi:pilus assembly protein CpaF